MDAHAKYDQKRRACESRIGKYLTIVLSHHPFLEKKLLTSSKMTHSFSEALSISPSIGEIVVVTMIRT